MVTKLSLLTVRLVVVVTVAHAQDRPERYASGQFPTGTVYTESDLSALVGATLSYPAYLVDRFAYLGVVNGRQLFSTYRSGIIDPNGIAFGNVLMAVAFHDNAPRGLEVGKVIVSTQGPGASGSHPVPVFWPPCDWGLSAGIRVDMPGAVKEGLPPVIQRLIKWRLRNNLSQRGAVEVMMKHGLKVSRTTLQHWEQKVSAPNNLASKAIQDFLKQHPKIKNPPRYKPGPK
jgi:hypothetical protein